MKIKQIFTILSLATLTLVVSCTPKDSDLQKSATEVLVATPGISVAVKDGVATLTGNVTDATVAAAAAEATGKIKGIKSVNNMVSVTVIAPVPMPEIATTDALTMGVNDVIKDFPGVTTTITDGVIAVTGELSAEKWKTLKMALDALNPKKVDATGVVIK